MVCESLNIGFQNILVPKYPGSVPAQKQLLKNVKLMKIVKQDSTRIWATQDFSLIHHVPNIEYLHEILWRDIKSEMRIRSKPDTGPWSKLKQILRIPWVGSVWREDLFKHKTRIFTFHVCLVSAESRWRVL